MALILSGSDGLSDVDGSAATPAIRGTDANTGIFFPAADTIAFSEGGVEAARFDSSGNLLLAGTSARQRLTIGSTSVVSTSTPEAIDLGATYSNTAGQNLKIYTFNDGATKHGIGVSTGSSDYVTPTSGRHTFYVNTSEVARIDSSGNLDLATGGAVFTTNRGLYSQQTKFYQGTGGGGAFYETTNPSINAQYYPHVFQGVNNAPTTIEYGRFNEFGLGLKGATPSSGTGITFPATQSASSNANTLDDYEEGTWTPVMGDLNGNNFTTSISDGRYTKIGNQVTASLIFNWSSIGSATSSGLRCTLPFACVGNNFARFSAAIGYMSGFDTTVGTKQITSNLDQGLSYLTFYQTNDNTDPTLLPANSCSASGGLQATITYFV